jgi:hypothetical protein
MYYQNFDLEIISSNGGRQFSARVLESPQGDSPFAEVKWPFAPDEETEFLGEIYGGLRQRRVRSARMTNVQDFGGRLFDAVFTGDIKQLFRSSLDASFKAGTGLRIRLRLPEESELHALPWEFLFDTESQEFLAVREHTPLVRYLPVAQPIPPITVDGPLRILVALAAPTDHPRLDVGREWDILNNALASTVQAGQVELRRVTGRCTFDNLRDSLRHFGAHIFHFVGHGVPGALVFEQESGKGFEMEAAQLRSAFPSGTLPRLVVLNSCSGAICEDVPFSGLAQGFLRQGVPAVVAMQAPITDDAALIFTRFFYRDLVETGAVDTSLTEARLRMKANGHPVEWGTPVLYMRALSGQLFQPGGTLDERTILSKEAPVKQSAIASVEPGLAARKRPKNANPTEIPMPPRPEPVAGEQKKLRGTQKRESPSPQAPPHPAERKKPRDTTPRQEIPQANVEPTVELKAEPVPKPKPRPRSRAKLEPKLEPRSEAPPEAQPELQPEPPPEPQPEPRLDEPEATLHDSARETTVIFTQGPKRAESAMPPRIQARKPFTPLGGYGSLGDWLHRAWPFLGLLLVFLVTVISVSAWLSRSDRRALPAKDAVLAPVPAPAPPPDLAAKLPVAPMPVPAHVESARPPVMPPKAQTDTKPAPLAVPKAADTKPARLAPPNVPDTKPASPVVRKAPVQQPASRKPPSPAANKNCNSSNVSERSIECLFSK